MTTNLLDFLETPKNLSTLSISLDKDFCRCCHSEGSFLSLEGTVVNDQGEEECFKDLLRDFLNAYLPKVEGIYQNVTYKICTLCVWKLREAISFKIQVLNCEEKFREFLQQTDFDQHDPPFQEDDECDYIVSKLRDDDEMSMDAEVLDENLSDDECEIVPVDINIDDIQNPTSDIDETVPIEYEYSDRKLIKVNTKKKINNDSSNTKVKKPRKPYTRRAISDMVIKKPKIVRGVLEIPNQYTINTLREGRSEQQGEYKENGDGSFNCCRCDTVEQKYKRIVRHVALAHKDEISDFLPTKGFQGMFNIIPNDKFKCYICNKQQKFKNNILKHIERNHFKLKRFYCEICRLRFTSSFPLAVHEFEVHQIDNRISCNACDKKFFNKQALNSHIDKFHMMGGVCHTCDFQALSYTEMKKHKASHQPPKVYKCGECGKVCINNMALSRHKVLHKTTKDFNCKFCKKSFKRKTTLKLHEKIHTGEKNKICKECGEGFVQKASLNYHMGKHHPEVPF